jgi:hypothetical protein
MHEQGSHTGSETIGMHNKTAIFLTALLVLSGGAANAYQFWGVTVGTQTYSGSSQLTFDGLANSNIQYTVGGYEYTRVDSQWLGPFSAADPGAAFLISRKCDAQGLFFKADADAARFVIITGSNQNGVTAPEVGCGSRKYGPGDLKIDVDGVTYGVGLRASNLLWAVDPATTNPEFRLLTPSGGFESIYARDAGTAGRVEVNPRWARTGHSTLAAGSDKAYAFYVAGSGTQTGQASIGFESTGLMLGAVPVYAYQITVPWSAIGMGSTRGVFRASYRPDCGNDILSLQAVPGELAATPEPGACLTLAGGCAALGLRRIKK